MGDNSLQSSAESVTELRQSAKISAPNFGVYKPVYKLEMACMVRGEAGKSIARGVKSVRAKMDVIAENTRAEVMREKRAKEAMAAVNAREERVLNKKRKILDQIKEVEKDIEKAETKESSCKERMYFAQRRYDENSKMKLFLEKNKVDVGSIEHTVEQYREKTRTTVDNIAKMLKAILAKEKLILGEEKREIVARDNMARIQEKLRAVERAGTSITMNYTPMNEKQYLDKVELLREKIITANVRRKKSERKADSLEKHMAELEKKIAMLRKRNAELTQTTNEMKGSRI